MTRRKGACAALCLLFLALFGGCGFYATSDGYWYVGVYSITGPFPAGVSVPFTVTGEHFSNFVSTTATVRFTAVSGTPFQGGTSAVSEDVLVTIGSDATVSGNSPVPVGVADFQAFVTVILPSGASGTSVDPIATFLVQPPDAFDDAYNATGNVLLTVNAAAGVLGNDVPPGTQVTAFDATSVNGGTVVMAANGSFTYDPATGFEGADTFTYTVGVSPQSDTATVTVTVTGMVWFINTQAPAGGDGRFSAPFNTVAAFNAVQGGGGGGDPAAGDTIFVYRDPGGAVPGSLTLLADQKLIGQGVDLIVNAVLIVPLTSNPTLQAGAGTTVTLATGNTVRGITLVNTAGTALAGSGIGLLTVNTVTLTATGGPALSLQTGAVAATFTSVSSTASPGKGVFLNAVSGTLDVGLCSVTGAATHGVHVQSCPAAVTFAGLTVLGTTGRGVQVSGSGAFNVTGVSNTIVTTTGIPLEITTTNLGAAGVRFLSLSSNGAPSGIVLTNTGGTGGLTVTGDGTAASNASGGTFVNSTGTAIVLTSTHDVSLTQLDVLTAGGLGIDAQSVRNLTYRRAKVIGTGNANAEHNIGLLNLFGTSLIEDVRVDDINETGVAIRNDTTDDATVDTLVIRRLSAEDHTAAGFAEDGVDVQAELTANLSVTVDDSDFTLNANGILGVNATSSGACALTVVITASVFNAANAFGSGGIQLVASGTSTTTFQVLGCTVLDSKFTPLIANNDDDATSFVTITANTLNGSGGPLHNGFGIQLRQDENGLCTALVSGNTITDVAFDGVHAVSRDTTDGTGRLNATITGNSVATPSVFGAGVFVQSQDTNTVRTSISGNVLSGSATSLPFDEDIVLQQTGASTFGVTQLAPTGAVNAAEIDDANGGAGIGVIGTVTFNAGATPLPPP